VVDVADVVAVVVADVDAEATTTVARLPRLPPPAPLPSKLKNKVVNFKCATKYNKMETTLTSPQKSNHCSPVPTSFFFFFHNNNIYSIIKTDVVGDYWIVERAASRGSRRRESFINSRGSVVRSPFSSS
jgi:hypothetical protein